MVRPRFHPGGEICILRRLQFTFFGSYTLTNIVLRCGEAAGLSSRPGSRTTEYIGSYIARSVAYEIMIRAGQRICEHPCPSSATVPLRSGRVRHDLLRRPRKPGDAVFLGRDARQLYFSDTDSQQHLHLDCRLRCSVGTGGRRRASLACSAPDVRVEEAPWHSCSIQTCPRRTRP